MYRTYFPVLDSDAKYHIPVIRKLMNKNRTRDREILLEEGIEHPCIPEIKFEDQRLTSFAGLVVFQSLFSRIGLKQQLTGCFRHLRVSPIYGHGVIVLLLTVHLLLGYRRLQDMRYYQDDPMVCRLLGVSRLPDAATVSRARLL